MSILPCSWNCQGLVVGFGFHMPPPEPVAAEVEGSVPAAADEPAREEPGSAPQATSTKVEAERARTANRLRLRDREFMAAKLAGPIAVGGGFRSILHRILMFAPLSSLNLDGPCVSL
jgi:hypothetical protein